ncbi:hypothetical protein WG68_13200 [Arsukibacterium ikkense]|jgi:hypothetical protein|uniref:Uncharacterized protein n=1 Tax=Arsukibacterium ikkense TaxID=336831 RepID=A0A0M2V2D6_9GAMM|nr:hypothetical protein WG68_13200 [Arsukibacterium ikkense]
MARYIVNKNAQSTGEHEVHNVNTCQYLPNVENQISLGEHATCQSAVQEAYRKFPGYKFDGCYYCSLSCHTR